MTDTLLPLEPVSHAVTVRRRAVCTPAEAADAARALTGASPTSVVEWAIERFGRRLVLTTSFADSVLVHLATRVDPDLEVVFLDTGFHFLETLSAMRRSMERYALNLTVLRPNPTAVDLWASGPEACCSERKTEPLDRYLAARADAWLSGVRRADSPERADAPVVSVDRRGLVKVNPIVAMSDDEYDAYIVEHEVVVNSLRFDGYASIGCWPCTEPAADRSGRWAGSAKTECGLHR